MRLIFAGTPEFAEVALRALYGAGHTIELVLTQPDRPSGRGMKLQPSAVKLFATRHELPLLQPRSLRLDGAYPQDARVARAALETTSAQAMVVAAYGLLLPIWVLDMMKAKGLGCLNIHASLLPRWRGAAPIHRAIEAGDRDTGVTVMQMDEGLDTGEMLLWARLPIAATDTTSTLLPRLSQLGADLMVRYLSGVPDQRARPVPQPAHGVCYARKVDKSEALIDWHCDATTLERKIRAFQPAPVAFTHLRGELVKIWGARVREDLQSLPGQPPGLILSVSDDGIVVACGRGALSLTQLQRAGARRMDAAAFLHGFALRQGELLSPDREPGAT